MNDTVSIDLIKYIQDNIGEYDGYCNWLWKIQEDEKPVIVPYGWLFMTFTVKTLLLPAPLYFDVLLWMKERFHIFTVIQPVVGKDRWTYELIDMDVSFCDDGLSNFEGRIPERSEYPVITGFENVFIEAIKEFVKIIKPYITK